MADDKQIGKGQEGKMKSLEAFAKKQGISAEALANIQEKILKGGSSKISQLKKELELEDQLLSKKTSRYNIERGILDLSKAAQKPAEAIANASSESLQADIDKARTMAKQVKIGVRRGQISREEGAALMNSTRHIINMNRNMQTINKNKDLKKAFEDGAKQADNIQSKMKSLVTSMPGGNWLWSSLGGDKISGKIQKNFAAELAKGGKKGAKGIGRMRAMVKALFKTLMAHPFLAILAVIGLIVAALGKALSVAKEFNKQAAEAAKEHGTSVIALKQMKMEAAEVSWNHSNILADSKDILAVQTGIAKEMGTSFAVSAEMASNIAETGRAFGFGVDAATNFTAALMENGVAVETTHSLLEDVGGELLGTGLNAGAVIADMTKNSKMIGKHFKGNVKQFKKAAIQAAKMGVSLETMSKVADGLLDVEGSLTAQYELQALSGRQFNFDRARALAMEGDLAGATQSVLDQVGGIHELNQMDYFEKKKLTEATGMEVDELYKAARMKEMGIELSKAELDMLAKQGLSVEKLHNMSSTERKKALAEMNKQRQLEKAANDRKEQFMKALLPLGEQVMAIATQLIPVFKFITKAILLILKPLKLFKHLWEGVKSVLKWAGKYIQKFGTWLNENLVQPISGFVDRIYSAIGGAFDWMRNTFNSVIDFMVSVIKAPFNAMISLINMIIGGINKIGFTIPNWVPWIGGEYFGFNLPTVPALEQGGSVGETGLAVVHKGEVVLPEAQKLPQFNLEPVAAALNAINAKTIPLPVALPLAFATILPILAAAMTAAMTTAVIAGNTATALIPKPVLILNPVLPTIETNPMINAAAALEVATGGLRSIFGKEKNTDIVDKLDDVIDAIQGMDINMDGEKVGFLTKVRDTFRRKK